MGGKIYAAMSALALVASTQGACTVNASPAVRVDCDVIGGEKLPAEPSPEAICAAVRGALAAANVQSPVKVEVLVTSDSSLTARIEVAGKRMPDEELAVMDRKLSKGAINMLARRIAEVADQAGEAQR